MRDFNVYVLKEEIPINHEAMAKFIFSMLRAGCSYFCLHNAFEVKIYPNGAVEVNIFDGVYDMLELLSK